MRSFLRRPIGKIIAAGSGLALIAVIAYAVYLASLAGALPWQTDPTRVSLGITPFSNIPGFNAPIVTATATAAAYGTPAAAS